MSTENEEKQEPTTIQLIEKVKGTEEFKTLLNNSNEDYWKNKIGGEVKAIYSKFDQSIETHLGVKKDDSTFSTDHYDSFIIELVAARKEITALKGKGDGNKEQEKLWSDKFKKLNTQLTEKDKEILNITQKGFTNNVSNQINTYLVDKTFLPHYSKDDISTLVDAKKLKIINNTKVLDNNKVAVWNPSKEEYYTDTLGEPLTPVQVAELEFKTMFHLKSPGGNSNPDGKPAAIEGNVIAVDMNKIKTKQDFYDLFKELIAPKGLASHTKEYLEIQRATMAHYNISALPLA